jgi:hypothetical protein
MASLPSPLFEAASAVEAARSTIDSTTVPAEPGAPEEPIPAAAQDSTDEPGLSGAVARALGVKRASPARPRR